MEEYINKLTIFQIRKLCLELAKVATRLDYDGDVMFRGEIGESEMGDYVAEGFYCNHSGEPLLEDVT